MASKDINTLFARAEAAFRARRPQEAETLLIQVRQMVPDHSRVWHLTALVAEADGRQDDMIAAFSRAVSLAPDNSALLVDFAERLGERDSKSALEAFGFAITRQPRLAAAYLGRGRLYHRLGRYAESRADLLKVYQIDPNLLAGWLARGAMELDAGAPAAAAIAYHRALALAPDNAAALYGLARIALERGEPDAVSRFAALAKAAPDDRDIAMGEAEARELTSEPTPHARLAELVARQPAWRQGHAMLGRMLWEAGDADFDQPLRSAIATVPQAIDLHDALIELLSGVDRFSEAADAAAEAARRTQTPRFRLAEAANAGSAGDMARAEAIFAELPAGLPGRALPEARHRIRRGQLDEARTLLERSLAEEPWSVSAWALLGMVWRATHDPRADWLHGQPGLIGAHILDIDASERAEIATQLRALHHRVRHPVGQSMRGGTQTRGRLFWRPEPFIDRLRLAISNAVMAHWRALPPRDDRHPLLRHRDSTPTFSGAWSVRLTDGGHHVGHIHPEGLLSSASYWVAPPDGDGASGWLEIGRPPANLMLDLEPIARFAPAPGTLVLFPSTMFHGTTPFAKGERMTVAFDIAAG